MVKREIIKIDEEKCTGCGICVPNCPEGALQIIDEKARLMSDLFCDGLGACIGHCPEGAIEVEEREAEPYDERKVMGESIVPKGKNTIKAHLEHLKEHNANEYLKEAIEYLEEEGIENPLKNSEEDEKVAKEQFQGCPGAKMMDFSEDRQKEEISERGKRQSQLRQWPVQLHLVPPIAPYYQEQDVVLTADCVGYALADFHKDYLKGKSLAIACPKLDSNQEIYKEKITAFIDKAEINTLTVMTMEVPCCRGLLYLAKEAVKEASRKVPLKHITVSIKGEVLNEEWVEV